MNLELTDEDLVALGRQALTVEIDGLRAQTVDLDGERLAAEIDEVSIGELEIHDRMIQGLQEIA